MKTTVDYTAAYELKLYADNSYQVYKAVTVPVIENLDKKWNKGTFDSEKAVKAFLYVMEYAAKLYNKEFGNSFTPWYEVFNKATREQAAKEMVNDYQLEKNCGH